MSQVEILQALPWCPQKALTLEAQRIEILSSESKSQVLLERFSASSIVSMQPMTKDARSRFVTFSLVAFLGGFRSHTLPLGRRRRLL
jgi:hypothetical protein